MVNKDKAGKAGMNSGRKGGKEGNGQRHEGGRKEHAGLKRLFEHQLADVYYAEKQLVQYLPLMAQAAKNEELVTAFNEHLTATEGHVKLLEAVYTELGLTQRGQKCEAIDGILKEGQKMMEEFKDDAALDAALVCAAQKVEHYEITSYGSLCAFAEQLGMDSVCDRLETILDEEREADELLSRLAEETLNLEADTEENGNEEHGPVEEEGQKNTKIKAQVTA